MLHTISIQPMVEEEMAEEEQGPLRSQMEGSLPRGPGRCWAVIDLDAFQRNLRAISRRVSPAGVLLVLKADAYGHGAVELAKAASADASVTGICVATQGEAIRLREAGIKLPILVLSRVPDPRLAQTYDLCVSVSNPCDIRALTSLGGKGLEVHLEIDTGMHRMGVSPLAVPEMIRTIEHGGLRLAGVYSHFACADEVDPSRTLDQERKFHEATRELPLGPMRHLANSAAALAGHGDVALDAVRVGGALYGLWTGAATWVKEVTEPIMSVQATIASMVDVPAGEGVGYGLLDSSDENRRIAILSIGYADGLPRGLGRGGPVLVRGEIAPTVGRISMDWTAVDVTDLSVSIGDVVTLLGPDGSTSLSAEELSDRIGTVSYELTCSLGSRLERRFVGSRGSF